MSAYEHLQVALRSSARKWLVTGVAGFIGSHLLEQLLSLDQAVVGLDNFSTGTQQNLDLVRAAVGKRWSRFESVRGDITDPAVCRRACEGVDYVLHHAALGSVPRSFADPAGCHENNVGGFLNMLMAARGAGVKAFVYASSSAVYGDDQGLPKVEHKVGQPLSPYAATKHMGEVYASIFARAYGFGSIGLRYFNVFGPRQNPVGAYAAVIPRWIAALLKGQPVQINGDGETSRDFCYVDNVVQSSLLAAATTDPAAINQVYNIALGQRTTLNELFAALQKAVRRLDPGLPEQRPVYGESRAGDVRHSLADISKARRLLGYEPTHTLEQGIAITLDWYRRNGV